MDFKKMKGSGWRGGTEGEEWRTGEGRREVRRHTWVFRGPCPGRSGPELFIDARLASPHCAGCSALLAAENRKKEKAFWVEKKVQTVQLCSVFWVKSLIAVFQWDEVRDLTDRCSWIQMKWTPRLHPLRLSYILSCVLLPTFAACRSSP